MLSYLWTDFHDCWFSELNFRVNKVQSKQDQKSIDLALETNKKKQKKQKKHKK